MKVDDNNIWPMIKTHDGNTNVYTFGPVHFCASKACEYYTNDLSKWHEIPGEGKFLCPLCMYYIIQEDKQNADKESE